MRKYERRNHIEQASATTKQLQRFATRYENLKDVYQGLVCLIFAFIHIQMLALTLNRLS